jgi:hypothetical protein
MTVFLTDADAFQIGLKVTFTGPLPEGNGTAQAK